MCDGDGIFGLDVVDRARGLGPTWDPRSRWKAQRLWFSLRTIRKKLHDLIRLSTINAALIFFGRIMVRYCDS